MTEGFKSLFNLYEKKMLLVFSIFVALALCRSNLTYGLKVIRLESEPDLFITVKNGIIRLKESRMPITGLESNVAKFEMLDDGFKIIVNDKPICKASSRNNEVVTCDVAADRNTKWIVKERPTGVTIETEEYCLKKEEYDDREGVQGYKLGVEKCGEEGDMKWEIDEISPLIYNGNLGDDLDMLATKTPEMNFLRDTSARKVNTSTNPELYDLKQLPEEIHGFF